MSYFYSDLSLPNTTFDHAIPEYKKEIQPFKTHSVTEIATTILTQEELDDYLLPEEEALLEKHHIKRIFFLETPLHTACGNNSIEVVKSLLGSKFGKDMIHIKNHDGHTPLDTAFHKASKESIKLLIEMNADRYVTEDSRWLFISISCQNLWLDILELLLKYSAKPFITSDKGYELLLSELVEGRQATAKILIANGINVNNKAGLGNEPFKVACSNGWTELVNMMLDSRVKVVLSQEEASDLLIETMTSGHKACAKTLIKNNIGTNYRKQSGNGSLHIACRNQWLDIVELLIKKVNLDTIYNGSTPLIYAFSIRDIECSQLLIKAGADVTIQDANGWAPIHYAARNGWKDIAYSLSKIVNVNVTTNSGDSPLQIAVYNQHEKISYSLIKAGADISKVDNHGLSIIHYAAKFSFTRLIKLIVDLGGDIDVVAKDRLERTPLMLAINNGHTTFAKQLLTNGVDVHKKDKKGRSAIHYVSEQGLGNLTELVIKKKTDINLADNNGLTPLIISAKNGNEQLTFNFAKNAINLNVVDENGYAAIHYVAKNGWFETAKILIKRGALRDMQTTNNETAIHLAISNGHEVLAKMLVSSCSRFNIADNDGNTALHLACKKNQIELIEFLLKNKASINIRNNNKQTPLHIALTNNDEVSVRILLKYNARTDIVDNKGLTPLHIACQKDLRLIAKELVKVGKGLDIQNKHGCTPLMVAIENQNYEIISYLLSNGADISIPNHKNVYPIHLACRLGMDSLIGLLLIKGANFTLLDCYNQDPLHHGISGKSVTAVKQLMIYGAQPSHTTNGLENSHFSLLLRNVNIPYFRGLVLQMFLQADYRTPDFLGNTPLHYVYHDNELKEMFKRMLNPQDLMQKNIYFETPLMHAELSNSSYNPLEPSLLKMDLPLAYEIQNRLINGVFKVYVDDLILRYGSSADDFFNTLKYDYKVPLTNVCNELVNIPNTNANLFDFLDIYDTLDSSIPEHLRNREELKHLLERIKNRSLYLGSLDINELTLKFCKKIEYGLFHVLNNLQDEDKRDVLIELLSNVNESDGKITEMSYDLYYKICLKKSLDFRSIIYLKLENFREKLLNTSIPKLLENSQYGYALINLLVQHLENPGNIGQVRYSFEGNEIEIERLRNGFFRRYTAYAISKELQKEIEEDNSVKEKLMEYLVENSIPIYEEWSQAFDELVRNKGALSEDDETKAIQERIVPSLNQNKDFSWKDCIYSQRSIFLKTQRQAIDIQTIIEVLKSLKIIS